MALRAIFQKLPKDIFFSDKYYTIKKIGYFNGLGLEQFISSITYKKVLPANEVYERRSFDTFCIYIAYIPRGFFWDSNHSMVTCRLRFFMLESQTIFIYWTRYSTINLNNIWSTDCSEFELLWTKFSSKMNFRFYAFLQ